MVEPARRERAHDGRRITEIKRGIDVHAPATTTAPAKHLASLAKTANETKAVLAGWRRAGARSPRESSPSRTPPRPPSWTSSAPDATEIEGLRTALRETSDTVLGAALSSPTGRPGSGGGEALLQYLAERDHALEETRDRVLHELLDDFAQGLKPKERRGLAEMLQTSRERAAQKRDAERWRREQAGAPPPEAVPLVVGAPAAEAPEPEVAPEPPAEPAESAESAEDLAPAAVEPHVSAPQPKPTPVVKSETTPLKAVPAKPAKPAKPVKAVKAAKPAKAAKKPAKPATKAAPPAVDDVPATEAVPPANDESAAEATPPADVTPPAKKTARKAAEPAAKRARATVHTMPEVGSSAAALEAAAPAPPGFAPPSGDAAAPPPEAVPAPDADPAPDTAPPTLRRSPRPRPLIPEPRSGPPTTSRPLWAARPSTHLRRRPSRSAEFAAGRAPKPPHLSHQPHQ